MSDSKIIVALDYADAQAADAFVSQITPGLCRLKVGKELFTRAGPDYVRGLIDRGFDIFLDLKFHDIPNTVQRACQAAAELGVWMLNVHASGGRAMLEAAKEGVDTAASPPLLIAVTVLTSMDDHALAEIGVQTSAQDQVQRLAGLAKVAGLDGVVCSAMETAMLRQQYGKAFVLVTPGIRPEDSQQGDQKRVMTPLAAIQAGSDYLVIGRPITQASDPVTVLNRIQSSLAVPLP